VRAFFYWKFHGPLAGAHDVHVKASHEPDPQEDLVHYALHAQIDERHAEEFFAIIEPFWDDPTRRYFIEQGLELGACVFARLYADLHALGKSINPPGSS